MRGRSHLINLSASLKPLLFIFILSGCTVAPKMAQRTAGLVPAKPPYTAAELTVIVDSFSGTLSKMSVENAILKFQVQQLSSNIVYLDSSQWIKNNDATISMKKSLEIDELISDSLVIKRKTVRQVLPDTSTNRQ